MFFSLELQIQLLSNIFLGLDVDDAGVGGVDVWNGEVQLLALLGAKPLAQSLAGLAFNLGRDVLLDLEQRPCQSSQVVGESQSQNDIGNEVERQDEIAQRSQYLVLQA